MYQVVADNEAMEEITTLDVAAQIPRSGKTFSQVWRQKLSDVGTKTFR
jgi:hypothetical protein